VASACLIKLGATILGTPETPHGGHRGRPKIPRDEIIRRAKELLEQREGEHVSLPDLVAATGVSERTLRDAFNESFGVSPKRYIQIRTLHQAKRALAHTDSDETTVAALLAKHGVWEFGRFAARYRRTFGELPSETLKQSSHTHRRRGAPRRN
jgi:AraC family ethanolamine operon transcriptional activator